MKAIRVHRLEPSRLPTRTVGLHAPAWNMLSHVFVLGPALGGMFILLTWYVSAAPAHAQSESATIDLAELVAEALHRHPEVRRTHHTVRAAKEVPSRMGSLPDPRISASLQNIPFNDFALDASPMTGIQVGVAQAVPFPGKLRRREQVAQATELTVEREAEMVSALVALRVKQAYWQLAFAEGAYDLTSQSEQVIDSLASSVHARMSVGQAAQQDALQAEVAQSRLHALLERRRQAIVSARRALNAAVGRASDAALGKAALPPPVASPLDTAQLSRALEKRYPAIAVAHAQVDTAARAVAEAERDRLPDFEVAAGYRFRAAAKGDMTHGADMLVLTLGMTLPIWLRAKQNARVRETRERQAEALEQVAATELAALTQLQQQFDAIARLDIELRLNAQEILPEADAALDASITDYQFARVGFVSVLRNWETQLDTQLEYLRLRTERSERIAVVELLTGALPGEVR